jgi:hypothetical protein
MRCAAFVAVAGSEVSAGNFFIENAWTLGAILAQPYGHFHM